MVVLANDPMRFLSLSCASGLPELVDTHSFWENGLVRIYLHRNSGLAIPPEQLRTSETGIFAHFSARVFTSTSIEEIPTSSETKRTNRSSQFL
jgi:hypothetical protein